MAEVKQWDDSDVCCFCVRCYSALGNIAKARYLKETVTIAEEVERQVVSVGRRKKSSFYIYMLSLHGERAIAAHLRFFVDRVRHLTNKKKMDCHSS